MRHVFAFLMAASVSCVALATTTLEDTLAFLKVASPDNFPAESTLDTLRKAAQISVLNGKITDEDFDFLVPLCGLENIRQLEFRYNGLTGAGLKRLADQCEKWASVTFIDLAGNPLEDEQLVGLNAFVNLESLQIDFHRNKSESMVTGFFLRSLHLPKLERISARGTALFDRNVLVLLDMPGLTSFNFSGSTVSDSVLATMSSAKINLAVKKWDRRRILYESRTTSVCASTVGRKAQEKFLSIAVQHEFFDEEAVMIARAYRLVPLFFESRDGKYKYLWICRV